MFSLRSAVLEMAVSILGTALRLVAETRFGFLAGREELLLYLPVEGRQVLGFLTIWTFF